MLQYICINPRKAGGSEFMYRLKGGGHPTASHPLTLSWSKVIYLYCIVMPNLACSLNKLVTNFSGIGCYGGVSLPPPPPHAPVYFNSTKKILGSFQFCI